VSASDRPSPAWPPRGMKEQLAAYYVGLAATTFRKEVTEDRAPKPIRLTGGRQVWLKDDLDKWLDQAAGKKPSPTEPDEWKDSIKGGKSGSTLR
jgi:predicted DNA-binding transcriptional regulator AlpA